MPQRRRGRSSSSSAAMRNLDVVVGQIGPVIGVHTGPRVHRHRVDRRGLITQTCLQWADGTTTPTVERRTPGRRRGHGDRGALDTLLARHVDRIHALCRRILGNEHGALDATQEALIAIAASVRSTAGRCSRPGATASRRTRPWTKSAAASGVRRPPTLPEPSGSSPHLTTALPTCSTSAQRLAIPPEYRAAVALRDLADLDYAEIAVVLGVPAGTVRSRIARGRRARRQAREP